MKTINRLAVVTFTLALVACGGEGSSSSITLEKDNTTKTPTNNTPTAPVIAPQISKKDFGYSNFDYNNDGGSYVSFSRTDYHIVNDVLYAKPTKAIIGNVPTVNLSTTYMADSKTLRAFRPIVNKHGRTVSIIKNYDSEKGITFTPYNAAKDTSFKVVGTYTVKDLSDLAVKSAAISVELKNIQAKLPNTLVFPKGSKCRSATSGQFIAPNSNETVVFLFGEESDSKTNFTSLSTWRANIASKVTINNATTVTGTAASKYKLEGFRDTAGNAYTGILYNGRVYNTIVSGTTKTNQAFEACSDYNKVAADFIEKAVKSHN